MKDKAIITAAITGSIHTPTMSDYLPITPRQIAEEAVRAYEAGAAVCHVHARDPESGRPVPDVNLMKEIITGIRSRCNMVICITTGGGLGMSVAERVAPVDLYKPELASFNAGSINFALFPAIQKYKDWKFEWETQYLSFTEDFIFPNTFKSMREYFVKFNAADTKPELEVYDSGMVNNVAFMIEAGYVKRPVYLQFVMGVLGGITPVARTCSFWWNMPGSSSATSSFPFASPAGPSFLSARSRCCSAEMYVWGLRTISTWKRGGWRKAMPSRWQRSSGSPKNWASIRQHPMRPGRSLG